MKVFAYINALSEEGTRKDVLAFLQLKRDELKLPELSYEKTKDRTKEDLLNELIELENK